MQDKKNKLFLSGGGNEEDSKLLDSNFVASLKILKVLYIPIAMPGNYLTYEKCYDWITSTITNLSKEFIIIDMCCDLNELNDNNLRQYGAIYIGGGNTYKLLADINISGFHEKLTRYIASGGIYYGGSAGAIIAGLNIGTVVEENDNNYPFEKGLGLVGKYSVRCHYENDQDDLLITKYISKYNNPVIVLPERCGLFVDGTRIKVIGYENAFIFRGQNKKELSINSTMDI